MLKSHIYIRLIKLHCPGIVKGKFLNRLKFNIIVMHNFFRKMLEKTGPFGYFIFSSW